MEGNLKWRSAALVLALAGCLAGAAMAQATLKIDPTWFKSDSAGSKVELALVAGFNGVNGGMNFNGATAGALTLTVPIHWTVVLHFRNNDQVLPHSAQVIAAVTPVPVGKVATAFDHAATGRMEQGLPTEGHEDVKFVADRAGSFLIFCAVPGHGAAGMWIRLAVSPGVGVPVLAGTPKAP
jgi:hypothetical protein